MPKEAAPSVPRTNIEFFRHSIGQLELDSLAEALAGPILTTGETVERFERGFAQYLGRGHAVGVTSCTAAIQLALLALDIGPGDEVITTPMTFIATAIAVLQAGAVPVFVDVEPETGNLNTARIEAAITPRTRAILPVHLYGQMCDMRDMRAIADRHGLRIVEDAAHCVEGQRDGIGPGELGDAACFSFYATKSLTCGEGGAVVVDDSRLADKLRLLRLHGMTKNAADRQREGYQHWDMVLFGWKYNMDNVQAALLLPQLRRIESNWSKRAALARRYDELLREVPGLACPTTLVGVRHAHHLFCVWVQGGRRDAVIRKLQERGVAAMVNYRPVHLASYFREWGGFRPGQFPHTEKIGDECLSLPFYPGMPAEHAEEVAYALADALR